MFVLIHFPLDLKQQCLTQVTDNCFYLYLVQTLQNLNLVLGQGLIIECMHDSFANHIFLFRSLTLIRGSRENPKRGTVTERVFRENGAQRCI